MSNPAIEHQTVSPKSTHGSSVEMRCAIVALAVALAGAVDIVLHVIWLPSLLSQLAVEQLRPDDAIAQALRGVTHWANWSHAVLAIFVGVLALGLLYPLKAYFQGAR